MIGKIEVYRNKQVVPYAYLEPITQVLPTIISDAMNMVGVKSTAPRFILTVNDQKIIEHHIHPLEILIFCSHFANDTITRGLRIDTIMTELRKILLGNIDVIVSFFIGQMVSCEIINAPSE